MSLLTTFPFLSFPFKFKWFRENNPPVGFVHFEVYNISEQTNNNNNGVIHLPETKKPTPTSTMLFLVLC